MDLTPLPTSVMPGELQPFIQSINSLLERLSASLDRERRFLADAAHECRPEALEAFTGKTADEATLKKLVADSGARNARVVKPGMAVTMDFRQDRVTVQVDGQNRIERASCG
ncbi:hypothetical protein G6F68_010172 [Rhizopus microsporus]|nr:hypothetical protein G6F68_010172 [Rhizopus microsporus]